MHRCWQITELREHIFQSVQVPPLYHSVKSCYSRLSRTCRLFSEIALDLLWENHEGYCSLLQCLPEGTWEMDETFRIIAALRPEDWSRVLEYSKRIKCFSDIDHRDYSPVTLDVSVSEALLCLPAGSLLPNVQNLGCNSEAPLFSQLPLFIGPHLSKIFLHLGTHVWRFPTSIQIASRSPGVREIRIVEDDREPPLHWASDFVRQLSQIRRIQTTTSFNDAGWRHISRLPNLAFLVIRGSSQQVFPEANFLPPRISSESESIFAALRSLGLYQPRAAFAIALFRSLKNLQLKSLWLGLIDATSPSASTTLFQSIASACAHDHLRVLDLTLEDRTHETCSISGHTLYPLLQFHCLEHLDLSTTRGFVLDAAFIERMAQALPSIKSLSIYSHSQTPSSQHPPIASLASIARYCPSLRHMVLDVNATKFEGN
ncbi:hypothetical protein R3P38DRAFT_3616967, partial [Favolaschia claudopus]